KSTQKSKHPTLQRFAGRVEVLSQASAVNARCREQAPEGAMSRCRSGVGLGLEHLAPTVETVGADVMAQMRLTGGRLDCRARVGEGVVRTMHAALGRRLLVLL